MIIGLNAYQINIKSGWQLKGALEDINVTSVFNKPEIISVWTYDDENNKWRAYLPNTNIDLNKFGIKPLNTINKGEGFWVNSIENININPVNYKNKLITEENKLLTINFSNVSEINNDCIINFGDGNSQEFIDKCPNSVTHIYKKPGVYNLYLISNNEKIEHKVVIVNNKDFHYWVGYVSSLNSYLEENEEIEDFYVNGKLYIAPSLSAKSYYWTNFKYVNTNSNINSVDGNNFSLNIDVKNSASDGGISAYDVSIVIYTDNGKSIGATMMGESWGIPWISMWAGDNKVEDLNELVLDFEKWQTIKLEVKNNKFTLYNVLNEENDTQIKELYSINVNEDLGNIVGIGCTFKGSGKVDNVKLLNGDGQIVYQDNFEVTFSNYSQTTTINTDEVVLEDAYVKKHSYNGDEEADTNYNNDKLYLAGEQWTVWGTGRILIKIDVDKIPNDFNKVYLKLYAYEGDERENYDSKIELYEVIENWNENNVTWNTTPKFDKNTLYDSVIIYHNNIKGWYKWDITKLVKKWKDGAPNDGLILYCTDKFSGGGWRAFYSSENNEHKDKRPMTINI